jgi:hypothetical protein
VTSNTQNKFIDGGKADLTAIWIRIIVPRMSRWGVVASAVVLVRGLVARGLKLRTDTTAH